MKAVKFRDGKVEVLAVLRPLGAGVRACVTACSICGSDLVPGNAGARKSGAIKLLLEP